jgi:V/A-type H+-transporting ATPase subunit A
LINDAFLRQSAFSEIDRQCSPQRQAAMMRLIGKFIEQAEVAVTAGVHPERLAQMRSLRPLQRMGEEVADSALERLAELEATLDREFAEFTTSKEASDATDR